MDFSAERKREARFVSDAAEKKNPIPYYETWIEGKEKGGVKIEEEGNGNVN